MAKSPVYGRGRNLKHRWRGKKTAGPHHAAAANINMRRKKTKKGAAGVAFVLIYVKRFSTKYTRRK